MQSFPLFTISFGFTHTVHGVGGRLLKETKTIRVRLRQSAVYTFV